MALRNSKETAMDAYKHAQLSARRYGGTPEDYIKIHQFLDSSKETYADHRHRAILHNTFGIGLALKLFGPVLKISKKTVSVRIICENHITEDLGFIPTVQDWCENIRLSKWMMRDQSAKDTVAGNTRLAKLTSHNNNKKKKV